MTRRTQPTPRRRRAAVGVAIAFAVGVAWGATRTAAQPGTRVFTGEVGLVLSYIKTGQGPAFERTMTRVSEALAGHEEFDRRRQGVNWKVYKATDPLLDGTVLYISLFDPVITGTDYWVPQILNEAFPTEVQELYETYAGAFADGQMLMNLTPVDLGLTPSEP